VLPTIPKTTGRPDRLTSILGARLSWHFANGWVFEPAIVGPDIVDYTLKEGPHKGRHAIQHFYYQCTASLLFLPGWPKI
jgi:hypothetical protein